MRMVPTRIHAMIDYPLGILLIVAPWLFSFADESNAAKWISILAGIAVIVMSAMTNYELGVMRRIPMAMHNWVDVIVGAFFIISPWLFGFSDDGPNAWLTFVVIGVAAILAGLCTENAPREAARTATA